MLETSSRGPPSSEKVAGFRDRRVNLRTQLQIGFEYAVPSRPTVQANLERRLNSVRLRRVSPLRVEMQGQTATLTGRVARETDREVAVRLAELEPGVETVRDQLTVETMAAPKQMPTLRPSRP